MTILFVAIGCLNEQEEHQVPRPTVRAQRGNAFDLPDTEFVSVFRLTKDMAAFLCEQLRSRLEPKSRRRNVSPVEVKVLCALRFYATGSYQKVVANDYLLCLSQKAASNYITAVSKAMSSMLLDEHVKFPVDARMQAVVKREFTQKFAFPGVLGAIDGTHVAIVGPGVSEHSYVNRKGYHSINVQIVCDSMYKILNISARFPGSVHDAHVWRCSSLQAAFEEGDPALKGAGWLLGDSGYPLEPWLLTPVLMPTTAGERNYNSKHLKARSVVERCIGVLKGRFRCLLRHRVLQYSPATASQIVYACSILHNMCISAHLDTVVEEEGGEVTLPETCPSSTENGKAAQIWQTLIRARFL